MRVVTVEQEREEKTKSRAMRSKHYSSVCCLVSTWEKKAVEPDIMTAELPTQCRSTARGGLHCDKIDKIDKIVQNYTTRRIRILESTHLNHIF